jgi:hypothetical protein
MKLYQTILFLALPTLCLSQQVSDSLSRVSKMQTKIEGNQVQFYPQLPELQQIAGAPKAFYSYFWEFGDGHYSTEKEPKKTYKSQGEYEVRLWATNNYDTGKPPATRPQKVSIHQTTSMVEDVASMRESFEIKRNNEPMPDQEMLVVLRYKNEGNFVTNGKLYFFYNEQKFKNDNFDLIDIRTYYGENHKPDELLTIQQESFTDDFLASENRSFFLRKQQETDTTKRLNLPLTLEESRAYYKKATMLEFQNLKPGDERNIFMTLRTTPEMIKDTSAIISVRGVYVPDSNYDNHYVKDMEMEIVNSHDPNKMSSNGSFMNYRLIRFKRVNYKIRFQNNGDGPARTIRLETDVPEMYDKKSLQIESMYPECPICPKNEQVTYSCLDTIITQNQFIFTFKNIYLPGTEQKNVQEKDSTKGFVKYSLKFGKDFHKKKTRSRTAIIFDKNEPIITNYSTTRFLPGLSIGAKAGYNYFPDLNNSESYFFGATLSPYKSYRWYWQVEWLNSFHTYESGPNILDEIITNAAGTRQLRRTTTQNEYTNVNWEVPILLRYNINNFIGIGAGAQLNFNVSEERKQAVLIEDFEMENDSFLINSTSDFRTDNSSFDSFKTGFLVDATFGFARLGPSLGLRYVMNFEDNFNYLQVYGIWRF